MSALTDLPVVLFFVALLVLGMAAEAWGADTRPSILDDHRS